MSACLNHPFAPRIRDLLALRLSDDKIARRPGMSPTNVGKIARQLAAETPPLPDESPPGFDERNLRRCPQCGGMVYLWPCLTCTVATHERQTASVRVASRARARRVQRSS